MGLKKLMPANRKLVAVMMTLPLLVLTGCSQADKDQIARLAMPIPATEEAHYIYDLWQWFWYAAIVVGVIVWGLIFYAAVKFRRKHADEVPVQIRYHLPIEILYTLAPVVMVFALFAWVLRTQDAVAAGETQRQDRVINVVGQQWSWTFNYTKEKSIGGKTVYDVGTTADFPTLYLPVNERIKIVLTSPDVIHDFWVPAFLYKEDVIPGQVNEFSMLPNKIGNYVGKCAELCGTFHSRMLFNVKVVSKAEYEAHLKDLQKAGNVGLNLGGTDATTVPGLEKKTAGGEK